MRTSEGRGRNQAQVCDIRVKEGMAPPKDCFPGHYPGSDKAVGLVIKGMDALSPDTPESLLRFPHLHRNYFHVVMDPARTRGARIRF